jgi:hypothetical protein
MKGGAQSRLRLVSALTIMASVVAFASFMDRVFWWTHKQFASCATQTWGTPQPPFCRVVSELDWMIWYGPLISLVISLIVLLLRRQRWHSSPFTPAVVLAVSALMFARTMFVMFAGLFLRDMH